MPPPYVCVALDLDHALCRYRIHALQHLIYACLVRALVEEQGAPLDAFKALPPVSPSFTPLEDVPSGTLFREDQPRGVADAILDALDTTDIEKWGVGWCPAFVAKGLVFDAQTGDLLKLGPEGAVLHAWHGLRELTCEELVVKYSGVWWGFTHLQQRQRHENFSTFLTYFDAPAALTLAQWVTHVDMSVPGKAGPAGAGSTASVPASYAHLLKSHGPAFNHIFDNTSAFPTGRGGFFSALRRSPSRYLVGRQGAVEALQKLRGSGTKVVLVTNSTPIFARFLLETVLGKEWRACFDASVYSSNKPEWFLSSSPAPLFLAPFEREGDGVGAFCDSPTHLVLHPESLREYVGGSASHLFDSLALSPGQRCLYVGDHLHGDVVASKVCPRGVWEAAAVVEEVCWETAAGQVSVEVSPWGSFFTHSGNKDTLWGALLKRHADMVEDDVESLLWKLTGRQL